MPDEEYYQRWYAPTHYSGALGAFTRLGHRRLESRFGKQDRFERVLEIGAHKGEHVGFVLHDYEEYVCSDLQDVKCDALDPRIPSDFAPHVGCAAIRLSTLRPSH